MSLDQLRKRIQELKEKGLLRSGYEAPGMEDIYPPTNPAPVKPYRAQEIVAPTVPTVTPVSTNAPKPVVPSVNTANNNQPKNEPKMGQNGSKALDEFLANISDYYREQRSQDLTDAYSAGFNGLDISRKTRDNAAVDGNLKQIEAMYNAGLADARAAANAKENKNETNLQINAKAKATNDISSNDLNTEATRKQMQNIKQAELKARSISTPDDYGIEAAQHGKLMRALNIKQAQKLAHTSNDSDDNYFDGIGLEAHQRNQFLQKKIDNQGKSGYNSNGISKTAGSALIDFDEVDEKEGYKLSDVSFIDGKKNVECVVYANNRAREYWGIKGSFGITSIAVAVKGDGTASFLEIHPGKDMQTLIDMPSHSLAFFGPHGTNTEGHEVFIEGKDDKYIYFSESNYGDAPTNGKVQRITYEEFFKRGGGFIGYAAIDMTKYNK